MERDVEKYLKKTSLFNCLNSFQIARLGRAIAIKSYKKNALIFSEGDPASGFYIVVEGKVKVYKLSAGGKEYIMNVFLAASGQFVDLNLSLDNDIKTRCRVAFGKDKRVF